MSKNKNEGVNPSWGYAYVLPENACDRMVGKVLTLIEVMGLESKQEESTKQLIQQSIRSVFYEDSVWIKPERHDEIRTIYFDERNKIGRDYPMGAI